MSGERLQLPALGLLPNFGEAFVYAVLCDQFLMRAALRKLSIGTFEVPKCVTVKELLDEYVNLYGREKWSFSTYDGNISTINNYIIPTIGNKKLDQIDNHFIEKYYQELWDMPAVKSTRNMDESGKITAATVGEIHKILRSCFWQEVKWGIMKKNPATDATVPKYKKEEREIWTAEMLM